VAQTRLPLLRRISQVFFLLVFLALLIFTSMRPASASSGDIHMRAPVRMFFVLDPLIAKYPDTMQREDLAKVAGYENFRSKGFANAIGRLRTLGFIAYPSTGFVAATELLFP